MSGASPSALRERTGSVSVKVPWARECEHQTNVKLHGRAMAAKAVQTPGATLGTAVGLSA
eukprot:3055440-Prymnesium_polylepis.1